MEKNWRDALLYTLGPLALLLLGLIGNGCLRGL